MHENNMCRRLDCTTGHQESINHFRAVFRYERTTKIMQISLIGYQIRSRASIYSYKKGY